MAVIVGDLCARIIEIKQPPRKKSFKYRSKRSRDKKAYSNIVEIPRKSKFNWNLLSNCKGGRLFCYCYYCGCYCRGLLFGLFGLLLWSL